MIKTRVNQDVTTYKSPYENNAINDTEPATIHAREKIVQREEVEGLLELYAMARQGRSNSS
jgi:hypothetical protein